MKKIIILTIGVITLFGISSCESFLDSENLVGKNTSNFPATLEDAQQTLAGVYNVMDLLNIQPYYSFFALSVLAGDNCLGGGGENDRIAQAIDLLMQNEQDMMHPAWTYGYVGVQRANFAIENLPKCEGYINDAQKNKLIGEAYFMRAYFYYGLASTFENIPLMTSTVAEKKPQASPHEIWGQIISDLKTAIELMPPVKTTAEETGHADKYVAEAIMARAFLFYTGFYEKTEVALPDGGVVTKQDVVRWINDCIDNSGYRLASDYRNLWAYTNKYTVEHYSYTKGLGLKWEEDDEAINPETMFAVKYSTLAAWSNSTAVVGYSNQYALYFGVRGRQPYEDTFPFGQGWGMGQVAPNLWDDWNTSDLRCKASVCEISVELPNYKKGGENDLVQETNYLNKKLPVIIGKTDGTTYNIFENIYYGLNKDFILASNHDVVFLRFADVLLMQSELTGDPAGMNLVRNRVGLLDVAYSLENLQNERRFELAFEGVRWNDIRRWHIAETALSRQENQPVYYKGDPDVNTPRGGGYAARYRATRGFFPIPETEIALSGGLYKQNEGWATSESTYVGWT